MGREMRAVCQYLHQKEDYLEMCYGYSRGVEITSDRESMGREREEREIDLFFFNGVLM